MADSKVAETWSRILHQSRVRLQAPAYQFWSGIIVGILQFKFKFYSLRKSFIFVSPQNSSLKAFFIIRPSPESLPVLGPLERPCYVALGWVLIWVVCPDWFEERQNMKSKASLYPLNYDYCFSLKALFPTKLCLLNVMAVKLNSFPSFQFYISFPGSDHLLCKLWYHTY